MRNDHFMEKGQLSNPHFTYLNQTATANSCVIRFRRVRDVVNRVAIVNTFRDEANGRHLTYIRARSITSICHGVGDTRW